MRSVIEGDVVQVLDREAAVALTDQIVTTSTDLLDLVRQAIEGQAWKAMGRPSVVAWWRQDVCAAGALRIAREHLDPLIHALAAEGASTREIASATGVDQSTVVRRMQAAADANASPEPRKARRRSWPDAYRDVHYRVDKSLISLENLVGDDRAAHHVNARVRAEVAHLADRVAALQAALTEADR